VLSADELHRVRFCALRRLEKLHSAACSGRSGGFCLEAFCRWARIVEAQPRFLAPELAEGFRRTPSHRLDDELPLVLPCFRLMLPDGALFTEDGVPIPVVIVADLRVMANWLPPMAHRISGISCVGLALDGSSYLTRHSFAQIGERQPTAEYLSHPAWQWDEQAVQSTNQRMEGLAINALLVQLYQPELLTTGPAAKMPSGKGFSRGGDPDGAVSPQGPVWIGKDFRLDRTPRTPSAATAPGTSSSSSASRRPHWRRGHWHTVLHGEKRQSRRMQWFQPVYVGLS
jgi:hypothetical protein